MDKIVPIVLPADSEKETQQHAAVHKVFELELLRETILDYVIHDKRKVSLSNLRSCRLVNRAWLQSASRILRQCKEPLFSFDLDIGQEHSNNNAETFEQFFKSLCANICLEERAPPFALTVPLWYLRNTEDCQSLYECLERYGSGLVNLKFICVVCDAPTPLPINIVQHVLPKVGSLEAWLLSTENEDNPDRQLLPVLGNNGTDDYIRSILAACHKLKSLEIFQMLDERQLIQRFNHVNLPSTLTTIKLHCVMDNHNLQVLAGNPLPNLMELQVVIGQMPFKCGSITSVLDNVRKTLKVFRVHSGGPASNDNQLTTFKFPLMERLQVVYFFTGRLDLEENCCFLQRQVPKLKQLSLINHKVYQLHKWAGRSCFNSVTSVTLGLKDVGEEDLEAYCSEEAVQMLCSAFPNVQELEIDWYFPLSGLTVIWREMIHMRKLVIRFWRPVNKNELDALLLGIPTESIEGLRNSPEVWDKMEVTDGDSIRNLTELNTLHVIPNPILTLQLGTSDHLFTDVAFRFAFFKMPKLTKLIFGRLVFEGEDMIQKWREEGRCFGV